MLKIAAQSQLILCACVVQVIWQIQKLKHLVEHVRTCMDESSFKGHHVSKDFCTPVINGVCIGSQGGKFWGRIRVQNNFSYCLLLIQIGTIMASVRDSRHYSSNLLQGGLEDSLLQTFMYMAVLLAKACAVITNSTLIHGNFCLYRFSLDTAAMPFNFPILM